jgi:hypothetical protein
MCQLSRNYLLYVSEEQLSLNYFLYVSEESGSDILP